MNFCDTFWCDGTLRPTAKTRKTSQNIFSRKRRDQDNWTCGRWQDKPIESIIALITALKIRRNTEIKDRGNISYFPHGNKEKCCNKQSAPSKLRPVRKTHSLHILIASRINPSSSVSATSASVIEFSRCPLIPLIQPLSLIIPHS